MYLPIDADTKERNNKQLPKKVNKKAQLAAKLSYPAL